MSEMLVQLKDFPDYMVSSEGAIVSLKSGTFQRLRTAPNGHGYAVVNLCIDGVKHLRRVHRLVAETFLGTNSLWVNHKNGIKTDNRIDNLEFVTPSENSKHAWKTGLITGSEAQAASLRAVNRRNKGEVKHNAKLTNADAKEILAAEGVVHPNVLAARFKVTPPVIYNIWSRRAWKCIDAKV